MLKNYGGAAITVEYNYTQLGVCIIETGWGLTTINSSPRAHNYIFLINSLEGALVFTSLKRSLTMAETLVNEDSVGVGITFLAFV